MVMPDCPVETGGSSRGVPRVWVDEAEIEIGDSLTAKIEEGMKVCRFIGVVLSTKSVGALE
jgi:hypothetical protein